VAVDRSTLQRRWVHAHEEDSGDSMVFRPADHPLPPSRGRTALDLRADGTYTETGIGPTDRPEDADGTWQLEGNRLELTRHGGGGRVVHIVSADDDRLVVRRG
jgi:hypothetical protein